MLNRSTRRIIASNRDFALNVSLLEQLPDRFFDVNEGRGWRTNSGKPVDDWKKLAAVWDRNEHPKAATPPARTEPKANAVGKIPSVEEVMAKWGCDRETAQGYIDENMY